MIGTERRVVGAQPSSETMSANSGLAVTMPIALEVSIEEPPPMATMMSAPEAAKASSPALTLLTVGVGFEIAEDLVGDAGLVEGVSDHLGHAKLEEALIGDHEGFGLAHAGDATGEFAARASAEIGCLVENKTMDHGD